MSSNINISKTCEYCGKPFTAKTFVTRYCSKPCNSKHYKQLARGNKIHLNEAQSPHASSPSDLLVNTSQEYFEVHEAAQLMRISIRTLYRLIALKKLKKKKLMSRTVILKEDIKLFFAQQ